jgi:hypothetical protein
MKQGPGGTVTTERHDAYQRIARYALAIGVVSHAAGLMLYDEFPYLYFFSAFCLSAGYYARLRMKEYQPFKTAAFYGMALVLALPVIGPVAGFQKIGAMPRRGEEIPRESKKMTTWISLGIFVIFVLVLVMLALPSFGVTGTGWVWTARIIFGVVLVALLAAFLLTVKTARRNKGGSLV